MLNLARALNPVLARPEHATALFTDHVFLAMLTHLAGMYGGLDRRDMRAFAAPKGRMLTSLQEHRVTSLLLGDLSVDGTRHARTFANEMVAKERDRCSGTIAGTVYGLWTSRH